MEGKERAGFWNFAGTTEWKIVLTWSTLLSFNEKSMQDLRHPEPLLEFWPNKNTANVGPKNKEENEVEWKIVMRFTMMSKKQQPVLVCNKNSVHLWMIAIQELEVFMISVNWSGFVMLCMWWGILCLYLQCWYLYLYWQYWYLYLLYLNLYMHW